jgi:putative hydrolase of the HAD superfamily
LSHQRTVVFDVAQVLLGWNPQQMLQRLLPHRAPNAAAAAHLELLLFENWGGDWVAFDRGQVDSAGIVDLIARRTGLPTPELRMVVDTIPQELQALPDTLALVDELLAAGHRLTYLSNMPAPYVQSLVKENRFFSLFADGIFSCDVGTSKPAADIFALAEQRFGLAPSEVVFLDDSVTNIAAAAARGWQAILFTVAAAARQELLKAGVLSPGP